MIKLLCPIALHQWLACQHERERVHGASCQVMSCQSCCVNCTHKDRDVDVRTANESYPLHVAQNVHCQLRLLLLYCCQQLRIADSCDYVLIARQVHCRG